MVLLPNSFPAPHKNPQTSRASPACSPFAVHREKPSTGTGKSPARCQGMPRWHSSPSPGVPGRAAGSGRPRDRGTCQAKSYPHIHRLPPGPRRTVKYSCFCHSQGKVPSVLPLLSHHLGAESGREGGSAATSLPFISRCHQLSQVLPGFSAPL